MPAAAQAPNGNWQKLVGSLESRLDVLLEDRRRRRQLEEDAAALRAQVKHLQAELAAERQRRIAAEEGLGRFLHKLQELEPGAADPEHIGTAKRQARLPTPAAAAAADKRSTGSRDSEDAGAAKAGGASGEACPATKQHQQLALPHQQPLSTPAVSEAPAAGPEPDAANCARLSGPTAASPSREEAAVPAAGAEGDAAPIGDWTAPSAEAQPNVTQDGGCC